MLADEDTIIFQALGSPATEFLGAKLLAVDRVAQTARFCFDARPEFANALGNIQGGFVAAILDETAGLTARLLTSAHIGVPTLDFRLTFFAPTKVGAVFAVGRLVRAGRRVAFIEADLYDEKSELLSRMSVTALIISNLRKPD